MGLEVWPVKGMIGERVSDSAYINLIRKWLKAGILENDGNVIHPTSGTPKGGIISPVLAYIYLHYSLDLWFEKEFEEIAAIGGCDNAVVQGEKKQALANALW